MVRQLFLFTFYIYSRTHCVYTDTHVQISKGISRKVVSLRSSLTMKSNPELYLQRHILFHYLLTHWQLTDNLWIVDACYKCIFYTLMMQLWKICCLPLNNRRWITHVNLLLYRQEARHFLQDSTLHQLSNVLTPLFTAAIQRWQHWRYWALFLKLIACREMW